MKRILPILSLLAFMSITMNAQGLKRVYDERINPMTQIDQALAEARLGNKHVICQVGGNWCPWCLRFADFITSDTAISQVVSDNFVYIHVNYDPRQSKDLDDTDPTMQMMHRLGNPARFGFPVLVVLNQEGKVIHTQDSSFLEEGKSYHREKVLRFFNTWTPKAVKGAK